MRYVLGVDGGGTKTSVALATVDSNQDQQAPLAIGLAGPSNVRTVGLDNAIVELSLAISTAFQNADIERQTVDSICLALAGSDDVTTKQALQDWVRNQQIAKQVVVTNDAQAVMAAAFQDQPGMAVISGTGSLVLGQDGAGQTWRAGGWGPLFGDQGSGYWLALQLFRGLAEILDQSQDPGVLGGLVANAANRRDLRSFLRSVAGELDRPAIAEFAKIVIHMAEQGDPICQAMADSAGQALANQAACVASRFPGGTAIPFAVAGSVLLNSARIQHAMILELERQSVAVQTLKLVPDVHVGTIYLASRELHSASSA